MLEAECRFLSDYTYVASLNENQKHKITITEKSIR